MVLGDRVDLSRWSPSSLLLPFRRLLRDGRRMYAGRSRPPPPRVSRGILLSRLVSRMVVRPSVRPSARRPNSEADGETRPSFLGWTVESSVCGILVEQSRMGALDRALSALHYMQVQEDSSGWRRGYANCSLSFPNSYKCYLLSVNTSQGKLRENVGQNIFPVLMRQCVVLFSSTADMAGERC